MGSETAQVMSEAETLVEDEFGETMSLKLSKKGRLLSNMFLAETVNKMEELPLNSNDVLLCSFSKSGCHWLWEVIRCLLAGNTTKADSAEKEKSMIEFNTFEQLASLEAPRVLNNHGYFEEQPKDLVSKKVKVIFIYRNVKDVAVSFYYHHTRFKEYKYNAPFSHFLKRFVAGLIENGSLFDYLLNWEEGMLNTPGLDYHYLSYEDMKEDPVREIKKVSEFLGTKTDQDFLQQVADATDFDSMKKRKGAVTRMVDDQGHPIMYRKGQVGDWKNHFTVAENEWMDDIIQKKLGNTKLLKFKYQIE